jgi:hypothetical protein
VAERKTIYGTFTRRRAQFDLQKDVIDIIIIIIIIIITILIIIISGTAAQRGLWSSRPRSFLTTHEAPQSIGLLWTSDQVVAETSNSQHITEKHPCLQWDSKPRLE